MTDLNVGKNVWYASFTTLIQALFTYVFWFFAASIVGADAVGISSTISSFTMIIATVVVFDTSLGMKRYLGIAISDGKMGKFKGVLSSTVIFVSITVTISSVLILLPSLHILEIFNIDRQYVWIIAGLVPATAFYYVLSEALVAAFRSKDLLIPLILGTIIRLPVFFIVLYIFNAPTMGTVIAYSSFFFISTVLYSIYLAKILKTSTIEIGNILSDIKHVLKAGMAGWIPHMISVLGSQLSILMVFSIAGSLEAGVFYLPQAIYTITLFVVSGINRVAHPLIAGMATLEAQTTFLSYSMKIAFMVTIPIAMPILFFAHDILSLMGKQFASGAPTLSIFMINLPLGIISEMVFYVMYGRGDNRMVLYLGLAGNIPRIVLYFFMVPLFGSLGAALAYLVGSIAQLILTAKVGREHSLRIPYSQCLTITAIPLVMGGIITLIGIPLAMAITIIFFGSFLAYIKLRLFTETELGTILYSGLPTSTAKRVHPMFSKIIQRIN